MTGRTIEELAVGEVAETTHAITAETIRDFVEASGDDNPIHSDSTFAAGTRFGRVIAPGMLTGSFVSAVIGTRLPGPGTVYLSQSLRFLKPVHVGDRVTVRVEVAERIVGRNRVRLTTTCRNQAGELLLEGEAWVLPSRTHVDYETTRIPGSSWNRLACTPATLGVHVMSLWVTGALAFTSHALRVSRPATQPN